MDTKWNNTHDETGVQEALDEVIAAVEQVQAANGTQDAPASLVWVGKRPGAAFRAAAGFLAFFLGLSLVIGALGQLAGRWTWERDDSQWWKSDWQETARFRRCAADYLEEFLTLGAGGTLDWYWDAEYGAAYSEVLYEGGYTWSSVDSPRETAPLEAVTEPTAPEADTKPIAADARYQGDKNVLYRILRDGREVYGNGDGQAIDTYGSLPEGYNFLLVFQDGRVTVTKDGGELDVYGDGIYDEDSDWYVPGYENFKAGEDVDGVIVQMAVRAVPIQYLSGSYSSGAVRQSNRLYWLYSGMQESQSFYKARVVACGAGLACLVLYLVLRRAKARADRAIAGVTAHVWTEARVIAVLACLAGLVLAGDTLPYLEELYWNYGGGVTWVSEAADLYGGALVENTVPLLALFWVVYLIVNDHRYTPKGARKSLLGLVSVQERRFPLQKRLGRWNRAAAVLVWAQVIVGTVLAVSLGIGPTHFLSWLLVVTPALVALIVWLALRRDSRAVQDVGRLMDQVAAVHDGDLTHPLELPGDADLCRTAEQLNDIQAGMERALAEQTQSERMKVELISNVSHDLKTPLTSILTYADLLTQEEDLPEHVRDYARIIDQKARRLSAMVGDVFEVSKAAAGQLPVKLERLDFAKLLRQTLADLDEPIRQSGLTFKTDLPGSPVPVVADGDRLYRVFQNLVQNALKYALPGSRVYLTLAVGEGKAEASLRNTSRDELPAGVDFTARFTRGDESRSDGGSGLGLSIASSFTEACGGTFRVETVADLFTTIVTLPLAE